MVDVVKSTTAITSDWLTEALKERGLLQSRVADLQHETIGAGVGLMGELGRLSVTYAQDESLPSTMIAKCAAQNENIEVARILDFYNREVNFYNKIGKDCLLNVPDSYYGHVNQDTYDCALLLEDLGDVSPRDQLVGASVEEAESAIRRIAAMHAKWWNKTESDWMYPCMSVEEAGRLQQLLYLPALEATIEKFSDFLEDKSIRLLRLVGERYPDFWSNHLRAPDTFIHGDYRQDNMIYSDGSLDAKVMDWQISGAGKGILDVTYFMCQSLPAGLRAEIEQEMLKLYVSELADNGVQGYGFDECWEDYRRVILGCLVYPVTVCGTLDLANDRGRALAECMLERNLAAIYELGCDRLV